jgi:putative transposase
LSDSGRTLKYENIYLSPSGSGTELREGIAKYLDSHNSERPHDGLDGLTPNEAYYQSDTRQRVA